jgi:hypothetical protein
MMKKKLKANSDGQPECSDPVKETTMTTTMTTTKTAAPTTTRRWKWSGETEEPDHRWNDEEECITYKEYQQKLKDDAWNDYAHAREDDDDDAWHENDECLSAAAQQHVHVPCMNLTKDERDKKSTQFKFGLCAHCDAGLDDESEFVCEPRGLNCSWVMACNACHDYYQQLAYTRGCGGCN